MYKERLQVPMDVCFQSITYLQENMVPAIVGRRAIIQMGLNVLMSSWILLDVRLRNVIASKAFSCFIR